MTDNQKIERVREVRLWIGQIIVPAITLAVPILTIPDVRDAISMKARIIKERLSNKLKKEKP